MIVRSYMSTPPIVAAPDTPLSDAMKTMRDRHIRRLPVVDEAGRLVGIVSDGDLLHAEPSPATGLSVWEITYLLARLTIDKVMTRDVLTVTPDTPLEQAAQLMCDRKIGGLPVVSDGTVVGVVTETDIFRVFTQMLGSTEPGVALTATAVDREGLLADITRAIADAGGDVRSLATFSGSADGKETGLFLKVHGIPAPRLAEAVKPFVAHVDELRG